MRDLVMVTENTVALARFSVEKLEQHFALEACTYGHKTFLTAGASGLIIDCVVARGNPRDSDLEVPLMKRAVKVLAANLVMLARHSLG